MPINPLQFTNPQAYSGGADFTPLAKLYDVYKESQQRAMQEAALGSLTDDPIANARTLTQSGTLPLAQLGLGMQDKEILRRREDIAQAQAQQNFMMQQKLREQEATQSGGYLTIAQQAEKRAAEKAAGDTPEGRTAKLVAAKINPNDPNFAAHIATGAPLPTPIALEVEKRNAVKFAEEQKYSTREARLQAVKDGELNINDPEIRRWVALGGEIPDPAKNRLGLGAPTYTRDAEGNLRAYQLSATGQPVEVKFGEGQKILGPGEIAQQKKEGEKVGAATGLAKVALPGLVDNALEQASLLDEIAAHPGRMYATGALSKIPTIPGTPQADFRARFHQIQAQSFLGIYEKMRGAGQITNIEGDKGTSAVNRMNAATTEKEFDAAAKDAKDILKTGIERAQRAATGDFSLHPKALQDLQTKLGVGPPGAPTVPTPTNTHKNVPFTFTP